MLSMLSEQLESINEDLANVLREEEDARDNTPENLQETERYEQMEEACDNLEEASEYIDSAIESIAATIGE